MIMIRHYDTEIDLSSTYSVEMFSYLRENFFLSVIGKSRNPVRLRLSFQKTLQDCLEVVAPHTAHKSVDSSISATVGSIQMSGLSEGAGKQLSSRGFNNSSPPTSVDDFTDNAVAIPSTVDASALLVSTSVCGAETSCR